MHENQILVLTKQPGKLAELEPLFDNKLEAFQEFVGGYIETFTLDWLVERETNNELVLRHRHFDKTKVIPKGVREDGRK